jgi:murein L,D-transpeptidase YafK
MLFLAASLLIPSVLILALIRFEKQIPPLFAADLPKADLVRVEKGQRRLSLIRDGVAYRTYRISLGGAPMGHKRREGDLRTPEGRYVLDWRNSKSCCYKSLHVSYPGANDKRSAAERGEDPGGMIMVHGQLNGRGWLGWLNQFRDWTHGCIAVRNVPLEEIWQAVDDGTPIRIVP